MHAPTSALHATPQTSQCYGLSSSLTAPRIFLSLNILLWFSTREKSEKLDHARVFLYESQWQVLWCRSGGSYSFNACQAPLASVQPIQISGLDRAPVFLSPSWKCHVMLKGLNYGDTSTTYHMHKYKIHTGVTQLKRGTRTHFFQTHMFHTLLHRVRNLQSSVSPRFILNLVRFYVSATFHVKAAKI